LFFLGWGRIFRFTGFYPTAEKANAGILEMLMFPRSAALRANTTYRKVYSKEKRGVSYTQVWKGKRHKIKQ